MTFCRERLFAFHSQSRAGTTWTGLTISGTKQPVIGNLPSRLPIMKVELLEFASVCE